MAPAASSTTTRRAADTRNLAWLENNVGAKLLGKMGWKEGQGVGRQRRNNKDDDNDDDQAVVCSEGIRVQKRQDGLGLGAKHILHMETSHTQDFHHLLQELKQHHGSGDESSNKRKKKRKSKTTVLPTNKTTHHKVRHAKFQKKSSEDLKCIFGGTIDFPVLAAVKNNDDDRGASKKSTKKKDKKRKEAKGAR
jgi:hypothetical protein